MRRKDFLRFLENDIHCRGIVERMSLIQTLADFLNANF
jgi:hypothetical protein